MVALLQCRALMTAALKPNVTKTWKNLKRSRGNTQLDLRRKVVARAAQLSAKRLRRRHLNAWSQVLVSSKKSSLWVDSKINVRASRRSMAAQSFSDIIAWTKVVLYFSALLSSEAAVSKIVYMSARRPINSLCRQGLQGIQVVHLCFDHRCQNLSYAAARIVVAALAGLPSWHPRTR